MKSAQIVLGLLVILGLSLSKGYAGCTELQGVTLCDNGDRQIAMQNSIYVTRAGKTTIVDAST